MTSDLASGARPDSSGRASGGDERPLLHLQGVQKSFGPVQALSDVTMAVPAGKVTALVGDNGAGKSTLIKTISGIHSADGGSIEWEGARTRIHSPRDAAALGIATVYQDLALCDNLDIVANMFLGREVMSSLILDEGGMETQAKQTLSELSVTTVRSIRQPVGSLSGGQRQAVAVARAVMQNAKLVVLDEPTAALGVSQTAMVLELIETLAGRGIGVLVISHNLSDVFRVADRLAVLYLGKLVAEGPIGDFDTQSAVELMTTGGRSRESTPTPTIDPGA